MKRGARGLAAAVAALLVAAVVAPGLGAAPASPSRQRDIQAEVERLRGELDEVAADQAVVLAELRVTQRVKADEQAKLAALDAQVTAAMASLQAAQAELESAARNALGAQQRLEAIRAELEGARSALREQAVASFMRFGSGAEKLDVILRAGSISELHDAKAFVDALAERQAAIVEEFSALEADTAELEAAAEAARAAAAERRNQVEAQTAALQAARDAQAAATSAIDQEARREEQLLESLESRRDAYEDQIRALQRESDDIAAELRRRGSTGARISGSGSLDPPVASAVITSSYGYRTHPIFGDRRLHTGLDFRASSGTPLLAARGGEVVFAGWRGGYGNCTIVDHGGGLATLYAHQRAIRVVTGEEVSTGQVIGAAGSTGYATGPHLHFEVRVNGTPVDPLPYL